MRSIGVLTLLVACGGDKQPPDTPSPEPAPAAAAPAPAPAPAPAVAPAPPDVVKTSVGDVTIRPLYHATLALEHAGKTWVFDPWTKAPMTGVKADVVLITDIHPDHLDPAALDAVKKEGTIVVAPKAVADTGAKVDVVIANGETKDVAGAKVTAVPMYNLTRGPEPGKLFHDKGRGNGYVVELGDTRIYVAGDTECVDEIEALKDIDVAFLPMNLPYTMPPDEAVACAKAFQPKVLYPFHYVDSDLSGLDAAFAGTGIEVRKREWYPGGKPF